MRSVVILSARFDSTTKRFEVAKEITNDDGSVEYNCQTFSPEALEWHAAMYDLEDVDEVIDSLLFEPFAPPATLDALHHKGERDEHLQRVRDAKERLTPRNGNDVRVRDNSALKGRMRAAGIADVYVDAVDVDVHETIKALAPFELEVIQVKRQHIEARRDTVARTAHAAAASPINRAKDLRARLATKSVNSATTPRADTSKKKTGALPPIVLGKGG